MERDHGGDVEGDLAAVVADEPPAFAVDFAGVEVGDDLDVALREHPTEVLRGDRLGERSVERGDVDDVDLVADATLGEVPVGQEAELERRDRALDRHVDDVDDEATPVEGGQRRAESGGTLGRVEGERALHPAGAGKALGLLGHHPRARRDDQHVVVERVAVGEVDGVGVDVDTVHARLDEVDPGNGAGARVVARCRRCR